MSNPIATDIFLLCIKEFLESIQEEKLANKVASIIEHDIEIKDKYKKKFNLKKMMKCYLTQNEDLKTHLEKLSKAILEEDKSEEESEEEKLTKKNRKSSVASSKLKQKNNFKGKVDKKAESDSDSEDDDKAKKNGNSLLNKKRKNSESVVSKKKNKESKNKNNKNDDEESDFSMDPVKIRAKYGIKEEDIREANQKAGGNAPFRRIDPNLYKVTKNELTNNSYDYYANHTGNKMGIEANNRLKTTAGKDFKKEKTKFKNKSGFGGTQITMDVKSIKLDYESESD